MKNKEIYIGLLIFFLLFYIGIYPFKQTTTTFEEFSESDEPDKEEEEEKPITLQITAVGDIMVHGPQLRAQWNEQAKSHDFHNNFQFVKNYIQQADLALCNLETTFAGKERGYTSFPMFNSPDSLTHALMSAGFDGTSTANNHTLDTGIEGMLRTIDVLRENGMQTFGTRKNLNEEAFQIIERNGIKIGLTAYTYETPPWGEFKTLNAIKIPKEAEALIDTFGYETLPQDLEKMKERIQHMKAAGAEVIIFYLHWGNEYEQEPNVFQRQIAHYLAEQGVDIIFGSHPHVLQSIEYIRGSGKETLVVYSMGNFLSNQRYEILKNRYTEDGIIVNVQLRRNSSNEPITIERVTYIPTWIHRYSKGKKLIYEILPLPAALEHPESYNLFSAKDSLWRAEKSFRNTVDLIEKQLNKRISIHTMEEKKAPYRRPVKED
ncbi:CapA family protein [Geosporobacter ferrireducens]|uniref:Capsule synthesis protein CapA domain-containing protein n=1 Tax=Geosporobacter ferrireducens TaxID=1424294 RepID=A0A1D8GPI6_9FIRM|nr:CapA family protein [Geosporobacter ferrireducens]AOT72876.1 hypothetical protein Gferi_26960 [Geosporobacter ferrireducens]MTI55282.1 CapA family protein [Geosporobacter ferrireducens]